ncbi:MAG: O-antigen ligase family protein [Bacteroidota bacterium]
MKNFLLNLLIGFCFIYFLFAREIGGIPYLEVIEVLIALLAIMVLCSTASEDWKRIHNELVFSFTLWFVISLLEAVNPGANILGWLSEIRPVALYPFLLIPIGFIIFKSNRQLDVFLIIIVVMSTLGALWGIKQLHIGLSAGERAFVAANPTHLIWGRLRVFSFYNDAGQFGASQASVGLITLLLALAPIKKWKRIVLLICSLLMLYGMLISGTRGALFAVVVGGFVAIILFKKIKPIFLGSVLMLGFLFFLRFTHIGDTNYQIFRLRTAINPSDPSLNVRLATQRNLREYMSTRPFGGGLGVLGFNSRFNYGQYLATVQPDSYFVKVWAMYGIVGLVIWLGIMLYILGKCCAIAWLVEDEILRFKIIALTAGFAGTLFCSYGNEVINNFPSSIVTYISWVFVFISPELQQSKKSNLLN